MSMNFYISGKREITVNKTGVVETQNIHYQPWQTPTTVTHELLKQTDPVAAYKEWVMSLAAEHAAHVSQEECQELDEWIAAVTALGYELEFYTL